MGLNWQSAAGKFLALVEGLLVQALVVGLTLPRQGQKCTIYGAWFL